MAADGLAQALSHAGVDYAAELATLAKATALGLQVLAVATTAEQGRQATAAGMRRLLVYPAVADGDPTARRRRAAAAIEAVRAIRAAAPTASILAFRHPDYGDELEPLIAAADGAVEWAIAPRAETATP
jgi:predicted TIM-barrel enzyme